MELSDSLKIIFRSDQNLIPLKFDLLDNISQEISRSLIFSPSHEYSAKSKVSEAVFKSFLNFWINGTPPDIQISNIEEYIEINREFQFKQLDELIKSKEEELREDLQYFRCLREQNHPDQTRYLEEISKKLDDYLDRYEIQFLKLPITSLYNIFYHPRRNLQNHNKAYELIQQYYEETSDSGIFSLLPSLNGMKLSKENLSESISLKEMHFGFVPTINAAYLINAVRIQEEQGNKINELKQLLKEQQASHNEFEKQVASLFEKLNKNFDELNETIKNQKLTIDELNRTISSQAGEISSIMQSSSKEITSIKSEIEQVRNEAINESFSKFIFAEPSFTSPGILAKLKEKEKSCFDRLFIASQSSCDIFNLIDPNTKDSFGTSNEGNWFIKFELEKAVTMTGIKIFNSFRSFPKSFDIEIDGKIVKSIEKAEELNGKYKEMTIEFDPIESKAIRIIQTGKNWDHDNYFYKFKRIEILSNEEKYSKGVFATLVSESKDGDPHKSRVHISSFRFDSNSYFMVDSKNFISTCSNENSWFQIEFTQGLAIIYGFRLNRFNFSKLKSYKIIGTNDISKPIESWKKLIEINEKTEDEHKMLDVYDFDYPSPPIRFIRLIQADKTWKKDYFLQFLHLDFFGYYFQQ